MGIDGDGEEAGTDVDGLVAGHENIQMGNIFRTVDIPFGKRHSAGMRRIFLQRR